jgi:ketosteroid isomerase-like protein
MDSANAVIESSHYAAWGEFVRGDPEPAKSLFSRSGDVTLGNPFGPFVRGWEQVAATIERAASFYRDGEFVGFERVADYGSDDIFCVVEVHRFRAKIERSNDLAAFALRVTTVLRREDDGWKIVHRHADPIVTPRAPQSVIQES